MSARWIDNILGYSLGLKPGERVTILCDRDLADAGAVLAASARERGAAAVSHIQLPGPRAPLVIVKAALIQEVRDADVIIAMRSTLCLAQEDPHIRAAVSAFHESGRGRWASLAQIDQDVLEHELGADMVQVAREARRIAGLFRGGSRVLLTCANGTDLTLEYGGRPLRVETGQIRKRGDMGNLPAGEVFVAPLEESAEGELVVDQCIGDIRLGRPVRLSFRRGRVVATDGGLGARELQARLGDDPWAWTIGEFGVGCNPQVKIRGCAAIDEKVLGTAHVALGANRSFGGRNPAATHYDCVLSRPKMEFT